MSNHDVKDGEKFSHASDESDHFGFSFFDQAVVERFDGRIVFLRDNDGHEEGVA